MDMIGSDFMEKKREHLLSACRWEYSCFYVTPIVVRTGSDTVPVTERHRFQRMAGPLYGEGFIERQ